MNKYCPYYGENLPIKIGHCPFGHKDTSGTKSGQSSTQQTLPSRTRICPAGFKRLTRGGSICPYGFKNAQTTLDIASAKFHAQGTRKFCPFYGISLASKFGFCPMGYMSKEVAPNMLTLNGMCPFGFKRDIKQQNSPCPYNYTKSSQINDQDSKKTKSNLKS